MADKIDTETFESPGWYLKILLEQLHNRRVGRAYGRRYRRDTVESARVRPGLDLLDSYWRGDPPLRDDIHSGWAAPFRRYVRMGRLNFASKLVSPTANRMGLRGFRTAAAADELGDVEAQKIMRLNGLRTVARDVHDNMLGFGDGYALITPPDSLRPYSLITSESPLNCISGHDPATQEAQCGLKVFRDPWEQIDWAYLYLPGEVWVARKPGTTTLGGRAGTPFRWSNQWEWVEDKFDDVPGNRLPLVRFQNHRGIGEFEEHLDHLDRINDKIFNEWWIEKIQAFRQRALQRDKDTEDEDDDAYYPPASGDPDVDVEGTADRPVTPSMSPDELADLFVSAPDAMWDLPPGVKMWESTAVDVTPMLNSIQKELQWLAAAADKPLSSLNPDAANQTAEGSSNQKEEHLYQVENRRDHAETSWASVLSHAFYFQGDKERADVAQIQPIWGPLERYSLAQKSQAASQAEHSLPREAIQRDIWQYDPAEIPQLRAMDGADLLTKLPPAPPAAPAAPAPQG